jgi:hypothetical protein
MHSTYRRFYDEDLNEIFLYEYSESSCEGIEYLANFISRREFSSEELQQVSDEYEKLVNDYKEKLESLRKECRMHNYRVSEEEKKENMSKWMGEYPNLNRPPEFADFLRQRLSLEDLELRSFPGNPSSF